MTDKILRCVKCGKYTMKNVCEDGGKCVTTQPARYHPESTYTKYRQEARKEELKKEGLL